MVKKIFTKMLQDIRSMKDNFKKDKSTSSFSCVSDPELQHLLEDTDQVISNYTIIWQIPLKYIDTSFIV